MTEVCEGVAISCPPEAPKPQKAEKQKQPFNGNYTDTHRNNLTMGVLLMLLMIQLIA